ncbi:MAG: hypothetical protein QOE00_1509, partial [Ilumatobacteraceae bacterium]
ALVAVGIAIGIAACGDPNTTAPLANQPKVIQLASATARDSVAMAPATAGAADSKIASIAPTDFVYDGQLPDLSGSAASWYFAPGQQPDLDRVAKLAASFGVTGNVRTVPSEQGGGWAVGPEDYSGPVLTVGSDGMLSWWLSAAPAVVSSSGCAVVGGSSTSAGGSGTAIAVAGPADTAPAGTTPVDGTTPVAGTMPVDGTVPECATPQPPAGVPTKDEALAKAKELFASWGYDLTSYTFDDPYADEWSASVNASLTLGGMKAPINISVGFGANATITWASGTLATPQRGADYPTVGTAAGLERLKTQQNQYVGMSDTGIMRASGQGTLDTTVAVTAVAGTTPVGALGTVEPQAAGSGMAIAAPGPAAVAPDISPICQTDAAVSCGPINTDPITVTLNSVKNDLTMVWATDQTIWLLPAYTFGSADGGAYTVLAVADSFIQQPVAEPGSTTPVQGGDTVLPDAPANTVAGGPPSS